MQRLFKSGMVLSLLAVLVLLSTSVGQAASPASGPPANQVRANARAHLKAQASRYGLPADLAGLADGELVTSIAGSHVRFQQMVGSVPVDGGVINVSLDRNNAATLVVSGYKGQIPALDTSPHVSAAAAGATALKSVGAPAPQVDGSALVIQAGATSKLAWKVRVSSEGPAGVWDVFVDAQSGQTLTVRDRLAAIDGTGQVFTPNPVATLQNPLLTDQDDANYPALSGAYKTVTLPGLDGSGYLRGPFVDASSKNSAKEPSLRFIYTRDDIRFEQVMAYYHIDRVQRGIQALGIANANNRQQVVKISTYSADNSYYNPSTKSITLGRGGVDDAEDADVIVHEYGHAIQDNQVADFGSSLEAGSMGEGFGDYLAFSNNSSGQSGAYFACIAEWDATSYDRATPPCLRRLDENKRYPEDVVGEVHADGEIWSRALFEIWNSFGKTTADTLIITSHFYLTPTASFSDGANAILAADRALYGGTHRSQLRKIFSERGIATN